MITPEQQIFLDTLRHCRNVSEAARIAKISRTRLYKMKASDKKFAKAWGSALEEAADRLTDEAIRRAVSGFEEVKYFKGEPVGTVRKFSDQLLMFLMKAHRPELYGQNGGKNNNAEAEIHHHARTSLLKKMETLDPEDDDDRTREAD